MGEGMKAYKQTIYVKVLVGAHVELMVGSNFFLSVLVYSELGCEESKLEVRLFDK